MARRDLAVGGAWAVTGATGFLGSHLVRALGERGVRAVALTRRSAPTLRVETRAFELDSPPAESLLQDVTVLVHAAYDFSRRDPTSHWRVNVEGSRRLLDLAQRNGVRVVHVSSLSAFPGCRSLYGRATLAVEEDVLARGGVVIRPGLIFGRDAGGIVGAMAAVVRRLPVVPLVGSGDWPQYTAHVADVVRLILRAGEGREVGVWVAAAEEPRTLRRIVEVLAEANDRHPLLLPVPVPLLFAALHAARLARVPLRTGTDSLVGLIHANRSPDFGPTRATGVSFRPFDASTVEQAW